jgi:hypothetical protein
MKRKIKIAFDIDGVCVDMHSELRKILLETTGIDVGGCTKFSHPDEYDITVEQVIDAVNTAYLRWKTMGVYPGVEELMAKLYEKAREPIQFVTNRWVEFATETYKLVDRFCKVPFQIAFASGPDTSKLSFLNGYVFFAEDRRRHALELIGHGKTVFLPDRSYNKLDKDPTGVVRLEKGTEELISLVDLFVEGNGRGFLRNPLH